jgi:hypothetical protein
MVGVVGQQLVDQHRVACLDDKEVTVV